MGVHSGHHLEDAHVFEIGFFPLQESARLEHLEQVLGRGAPGSGWEAENEQAQVDDVEFVFEGFRDWVEDVEG